MEHSARQQRPASLRQFAREAARARLSEVATDLFAERGFDAVTIEQIADRAGVSPRSVHRYFPTKEDMVIGAFDAFGATVRDVFAGRPPQEGVLRSLHAAFAAMLENGPHRPQDRVALRLLASTPAVRARNVEKHLAWSDLLTPLVAERLDGEDADLRARALVQAALGAFQVALIAWADDPADRGMVEVLDIAFTDLLPD